RGSEARLRRLAESNLFGVAYFDEDGRIYDANEAFLASLGYSRSDATDRRLRWSELTPPEYRRRDEAGIAEARERGACTVYEKECFRKDGGRVPILIGYALLNDPPEGYICFMVDLTTRKHLEAHLRRQTEELVMASRLKDEFLATLAHELRNPLAPVLNSLTLMQLAPPDGPESRH